MMADVEPPTVMTLEQAASQLGVSVVTVRDWIAKGKLRSGRMALFGRMRRVVSREDVERLARERQGGSEVTWDQ